MAQQEFDECIRKILQMDYGLVLISHSIDKTFKDEKGEEYNQIIPTLDNRARLICERTCDIIGYSRSVETENGQQTRLYLRGTPRFVAGSRFRFTPFFIEFTYDNLVNAIGDAITQEEKSFGSDFVTDETTKVHIEEIQYDFKSLIDEFQDTAGKLIQAHGSDVASKITTIVERHLGKGKKVSECTEENAVQIDLILFDLKQI